MIAEFGIDSGWLEYPTVMERLWKLGTRRWANRIKAREEYQDNPNNPQRVKMREQLKVMVGG